MRSLVRATLQVTSFEVIAAALILGYPWLTLVAVGTFVAAIRAER